MSHTNLSQQQSGSSQQPSQEIQEEEVETEPVPTPTSKKPGSRGKRVKSMAKKTVNPEPQAETVRNDTFWYKIRDAYNEQAAKKGFTIRIKNMLTGKWTPMNREVSKFNALVNETKAMSRENDENLMTRIEILYRAHKNQILSTRVLGTFLKNKHKWNNPESTHARRNHNRVTNEEEPGLFGDDALPRPPDMHRIAKSQRSSNSTASSGSNPAMFQEMMQQQLEIERKEKLERIDREMKSRVALNDSKKVAEDLKVLQISTDGMDPIDAAIVNAQKARIRALYNPNN
ncbi:hypothetical protein Tco_0759624 [Tanacetum coccineum]